jgi:tRNA threonylcarbamoyl adenosine modification protein (Sua5/YciO/YrdC/YwlC family)
MTELFVHPKDPQPRAIHTLVEGLRQGAVMIYPTDTVYGLGCDIFQTKAIERICRIKQIDPLKVQLSFICASLSELSQYTKSIDTPLYRLLRSCLPGPFTFILPASREVPKILKTKKATIGLRVPEHPIVTAILSELGHPILSASLPGTWADEIADPECIRERFENQVDYLVNGGAGGLVPSTIIDCTGSAPVVIREGLGKLPPAAY